MATRTYEFRQIGAKETARSLLELAAANVQLAKSETVAARATSGARAGQQDAHVKARSAMLREQARAERAAQQASDRAAKASARVTERAERDKTKAVEREAKKREQASRKESQALQRAYDRQVREHRRSQERAARAMRPRTSLTSLVGDRVSRIAGGVAGLVGLGGGVLGAAAMAGGAMMQATRERALSDQRARALAISGGQRDQAGALLQDATRSALAVKGTRTEDILAGQQKFTAMTGRLDLARQLGGTMATAARATGATEEQLAATMATFQQKFGIENEAGMQKALAMMRVSGQAGAFEIGDAASYYTEMGAAGSRFGLDKGSGGVAQLNALAQMAMRSTKSGAEASTGVSAMLRQLTAKSEQIKAMAGGKDIVFADKGKTQTNDVIDVLVGTLKASKGNRAKLQGIFGDEGMKGASEAIKIFTEAGAALGPAATEAQRLAAGEAAVRAAFQDLSGSAGEWSDVVADAAVATNTASASMTTAWETIVAGVGDKMGPSIQQFAEMLTKAAPAIVQMADGAAFAVAALARFGSSVMSLAAKLGIDMPGAEAPVPLSKAVELSSKQGEKAVLDAKIASGSATPQDIAKSKSLGGEIDTIQKGLEANYEGTLQSYGAKKKADANRKAGIADGYQDINKIRFDVGNADLSSVFGATGGSRGTVAGVGAQVGKDLERGKGDPLSPIGVGDFTRGGPIPAILDKLSTLADAGGEQIDAARALQEAAQSLKDSGGGSGGKSLGNFFGIL